MGVSRRDLIGIIRADELNIKNETVTLQLVAKWINFDINLRKKVIVHKYLIID